MFSSSVSLAVMARITTLSTAPRQGSSRRRSRRASARRWRCRSASRPGARSWRRTRECARSCPPPRPDGGGGGADGQPHVGIDGRRRTLGGRRALADQIAGPLGVLGREPVEQHAVRDLAGEPGIFGPSAVTISRVLTWRAARRCRRRTRLSDWGLGRPTPRSSGRAAAGCRVRLGRCSPGRACAAGSRRRRGRRTGFPRRPERARPARRSSLMVHPERAIPAGLGLSPTGADDVGGRTGEQRKSQSHSLPPRVVWLSKIHRDLCMNHPSAGHTRIPAWMCVFIAVNELGVGSVMPVLAPYARSFDGGQSAIGLAIAVYGLARFLIAVPAGQLADRAGRRGALALGGLVTAAWQSPLRVGPHVPGVHHRALHRRRRRPGRRARLGPHPALTERAAGRIAGCGPSRARRPGRRRRR